MSRQKSRSTQNKRSTQSKKTRRREKSSASTTHGENAPKESSGAQSGNSKKKSSSGIHPKWNGSTPSTSDSKKDQSLKRLRDQYEEAVDKDDKDAIRRLEAIFARINEQPRVSALSTALKQHTKKNR